MSWMVVVLLVLMVVIIACQWHYISVSRKTQREIKDELQRYSSDEQKRNLIEHRAALVSRILAAGVTKDPERSQAVLEEVDDLVSNREKFMHQTRLLYEEWEPAMMARLHECGLTESEMEICCLYALGLNGKSIQQYTQDSRHYQNVGLIRKKLGLGEHDKNIDGYIKSLIK